MVGSKACFPAISHLRTPSAPTLTPDGRLVAVAVGRIDLEADEYRADLWLMPTDGSAPPRRFTSGKRDVRPRFSPDGRWLAFLRAGENDKPQLHVMAVDGGEPRRLGEHPLGVEGFAWSPDSTRIAYVARVPEEGRYGTGKDVPEKEPPRRITGFQYRVDNLGFTFDRRPHVFVVDALAEGAEPVQLTRGDYDHGDPAWSRTGPASPSSRPATTPATRTPSATSSSPRPPAATPCGSPPPTWPSAGRRSRRRGHHLVRGQRARPGRAPDHAVVGAGRRVGQAGAAHRPRALRPRRRLRRRDPAPGGRRARGHHHLAAPGGDRLLRFPVDGGEPAELLGGRRTVHDYDVAGGVVAAVVSDPTSAGEVVVLKDGRERTLTDLGAPLARSASLRPMEELEATAPDGAGVHGWVLKPAGTGPFPVVLMVHGGPFAHYGWTLFDEAQVYAGAGYAVVMGNPRGSAGYGESHGRAVVGDFGNLDSQDVLALLDAALEDPDLDGDRVGVMGGSYGGFMTSWLVGHTDRFRAAISERACNAATAEGSSDIGWFFVPQYNGTDPARVAAQSPLSYADRIRTPMLLIHSEQDWRCPIEQAQRLFVALKQRKVEVEPCCSPARATS